MVPNVDSDYHIGQTLYALDVTNLFRALVHMTVGTTVLLLNFRNFRLFICGFYEQILFYCTFYKRALAYIFDFAIFCYAIDK